MLIRDLDQITALWADILHNNNIDTSYIFTTGRETMRSKPRQGFVEDVYHFLSPVCQHFLEVITNEKEPLSGDPKHKKSLSINRILGKKSLETLNPAIATTIKQQLYNNFHYGLLFYFYILPIRRPVVDEEYAKHINQIRRDWELYATDANSYLRGYIHPDNYKLFRVIHEYNFDHVCRPFLKKNIGVGFFGMRKYWSYFNNIYCSGALLAMMCDTIEYK